MRSDSDQNLHHNIHHLEKELLRENRKKIKNDSSDTDEDMKEENLSDEGKEIVKFMDDKDLIINGIQPKREDIEQGDSNNLFNDK